MPQVWKRLVVLVALIVLLPAGGLSADPPRTHDITVDDYLSVFLLNDCDISPDGKQVLFTELRWGDHDRPRTTDLWVVDADKKQPLRLTFDPVSDHSPQWAPDNLHFYFITKRDRGDERPPYDGSTQVWVMAPHPGEPLPVTRVSGGIQSFQLSADGRTLYYTKDGEGPAKEWKALRGKYSDIKFCNGEFKYTEIWKLDLGSWREEKVVAPERVITAFEVAPDEKRIALITAPDDRLLTKEGQTRVEVYEVGAGTTAVLPDQLYRADAPSPYGWLENLAWAPDGKALAFTVDFDGYPGELFCAESEGDGWNVWKLERPGEIHHGGQLEFIPDTRHLCFLAEERARKRVYCMDDVRGGKQGKLRVLTPGDVVVDGYSLDAGGKRLAAVLSDPQSCQEVYAYDVRRPDSRTQLSDANPQMRTWKLPQISLVTWNAPDGTPVEGILELPPDYKAGDGPLPMVVEIHGGPTMATYFRLRYWIYGRTLFAARGYALLSPNYRGSTGYGDKFLTDLIGRENDIDVQDILAGVDALVERGIADPERLGVMGWSNGGFLTNALITTTQRFKAASSGAGVLDQLMQWGLEDTPGHVINYMRGLPWERTEAYIKASPAYKIGNITTPTIIHVGAEDDRVPAEHARTLYRALSEYTNVPTVLLQYPGAGHGLMIADHRKGKLEWDLAWFDKYLLGKSDEE